MESLLLLDTVIIVVPEPSPGSDLFTEHHPEPTFVRLASSEVSRQGLPCVLAAELMWTRTTVIVSEGGGQGGIPSPAHVHLLLEVDEAAKAATPVAFLF